MRRRRRRRRETFGRPVLGATAVWREDAEGELAMLEYKILVAILWTVVCVYGGASASDVSSGISAWMRGMGSTQQGSVACGLLSGALRQLSRALQEWEAMAAALAARATAALQITETARKGAKAEQHDKEVED